MPKRMTPDTNRSESGPGSVNALKRVKTRGGKVHPEKEGVMPMIYAGSLGTPHLLHKILQHFDTPHAALSSPVSRVWSEVAHQVTVERYPYERLMWAIRASSEKTILDLLPMFDDDSKEAALVYAVEVGNARVLQILLEHGIDPSAQDNFAIKSASEEGHTDVVRLLVGQNNINPSANDNYAIRVASQEGHTDIVRLLLEQDEVDPSADAHLTMLLSDHHLRQAM